ncbi:uncharacterized protein DFL_003196 [Arthrobotrys flagrans]|uniref:SET domain-containing protein n=1 Tax=Arthrobotrys flagrans TaxID=97331 RepID=A0A437A135_ARTFL|nr:hypothetical protein DFL_003196 [Arthrobotrys flagrans]
MTDPDPLIVDISTLTLNDVPLKSPTPGSYTRRDLYEERQTPEAGIGAFATTTIPSGTRIFCEESLIMLPDEAGHVEVYNAVKALEPKKQEMYWALAASTKASRDVGWIEKLRGACDEDISSTFNDLVSSHEHAWSIYETNRFTCKSLSSSTKSLGIFPQSARLNHSCSPNVFHRYNPVINRLTVHALRDIQKGEELLTSYIDICHPTVVRRQILKHWGFRCRCEACDSPDDEEDCRRKRIEDLFTKIKKRETRKLKNGNKWTDKECQWSLGVVVKCIRLLEKEGMGETDTLGVVYTEGVRLVVKVGEEERAVEWAEKVLEIERKCLGEDSKEFVAARELSEMAISYRRFYKTAIPNKLN